MAGPLPCFCLQWVVLCRAGVTGAACCTRVFTYAVYNRPHLVSPAVSGAARGAPRGGTCWARCCQLCFVVPMLCAAGLHPVLPVVRRTGGYALYCPLCPVGYPCPYAPVRRALSLQLFPAWRALCGLCEIPLCIVLRVYAISCISRIAAAPDVLPALKPLVAPCTHAAPGCFIPPRAACYMQPSHILPP